MFTNPADARLGGQRAFHHRRRIDKGAEIQLAAVGLDLIAQLFQALAQQLVIVAPQRIAADVAQLRILQGAGKCRLGRQVVHAYADHSQRARQQFVRACAQHAVARHPFHFAVVLFVEPGLQLRLFKAQIGIADANLLES